MGDVLQFDECLGLPHPAAVTTDDNGDKQRGRVWRHWARSVVAGRRRWDDNPPEVSTAIGDSSHDSHGSKPLVKFSDVAYGTPRESMDYELLAKVRQQRRRED